LAKPAALASSDRLARVRSHRNSLAQTPGRADRSPSLKYNPPAAAPAPRKYQASKTGGNYIEMIHK
jgi:hypothetical protein